MKITRPLIISVIRDYFFFIIIIIICEDFVSSNARRASHR